MSGPAWENGVHVGRDGWLFWLGRQGEMRDIYRGGLRVKIAVWAWTRLIRRREVRAAALGARYLQVVAPDKLSVYGDRLAAPLLPGPGIGTRLAEAIAASPAAKAWVDVLTPLRTAAAASEAVYFQTDTHWTWPGALIVTRAICARLGIAPAPHLATPLPLPARDFTFDLGRKLDPPASEHLEPQTVPLHAHRVEENALARARLAPGMANAAGHHVGSRIVWRTEDPAAAPLRVVLFGDSYSAEEGYTLGVTLAESVREFHSLWSASIDWDYVARVKPDVVIHEIAERFLRRVPRDRIDIDAYAASRVARGGRPSWGERATTWLRKAGWPG